MAGLQPFELTNAPRIIPVLIVRQCFTGSSASSIRPSIPTALLHPWSLRPSFLTWFPRPAVPEELPFAGVDAGAVSSTWSAALTSRKW